MTVTVRALRELYSTLLVFLVAVSGSRAEAGDYMVRQLSGSTFHRESGGSLQLNAPSQLGDQLFFVSVGDAIGYDSELFRTDGNSVTKYDLNPCTGCGSVPTSFYRWHDTLYFNAFSNTLGTKLYSTTGGAPTLVPDVTPGSASSSVGGGSGYAELGDNLYFFTQNGAGPALYRTSGIGVEYVARASVDAPPISKVLKDELIFNGNGDGGDEPYRTDGRTVSRLADINPGTASSNVQSLIEYSGDLYLHATGPNGSEFFKTDGNSVSEIDINPGPASSDPVGGTIFKNELYFTAMRNDRWDLFKTNGIDVVNVSNLGIIPGPGSSVPYTVGTVGGRLYFTATGNHGTEFFSTDGTSINEFDINPGPASSNPLATKVVGDAIYFRALGPQGTELYKLQDNGLTLYDLSPGTTSSNPTTTSLIEFSGSEYVSANGPNGVELFRITGNEISSFDIFPGTAGSYPGSGAFTQPFCIFNGDLFFTAINGNGRAIYRIHGSTVEEVFNPEPRTPPNVVDRRITDFVPFGDSLYFIGETSSGAYLYRISAVPEPKTIWFLPIIAFLKRYRRR